MKRIFLSEYKDLVEASRIIEKDTHGEKVLVTQDGNFIKIFRTKKRFSTAAFKPYALRFRKNSLKLAQLQIPTVKVRSIAYCSANKRHLLTYEPLAGKTLREVLRDATVAGELLLRFARFLARLHRHGIYFRSIHFGNVIVQPGSADFGLIDIADMKIHSRPLPVLLRARNFRHFFRYREDIRFLQSFGINRFLDAYLAETTIRGWRKKLFLYRTDRIIDSVLTV